MTVMHGWRLLLVLVPVALLVAYVLLQVRRPRAAARFSSVDLLASVVPRRSGWQRHLPWAALIAALVVGAIAIAQPLLDMRTPKERATIMLVLDTSASMAATDVDPSRMSAAQESAKQFAASLPPGLQVGLVTFDRYARLALPPTTDRGALTTAINAMRLGPGTGTGAGIELALEAIDGVPPTDDGTKAPAAVVLMSDGTPTAGTGDLTPEESVKVAVDRAVESGVPITTIAFGTEDGTVEVQGETIPVPFDPEAMRAIAEASGGSTFTAESADELASVYDEIGGAVGYDVEQVEVTALFAAIAFGLACLAALFALIWTQRLA